jgi:biopolymer transport protein ExbD
MMKVRARRQPEEAEIIIIPMIDTMMFLLMFFIVASLAMVVQYGLPVKLPKASTGMQDNSQKLTLTVTRDGTLYVNTKRVAVDDETQELENLHVTENTAVTLNADANVTHGLVVTVMDNARKAGVQTFGIAAVK